MDSFILMGSGFQHVRRDQLEILDDGMLVRIDGGDVFLTWGAQLVFYQNGLSNGQPSWENLLNDLVAQFVVQGVASDTLAQQCYIELGKAEGRAAKSMDIGSIAFQRVREAALGFNLLAIGSTWRPKLSRSFPYWERDWTAWCDEYLAEFERAAQVSDFRTGIAVGRAAEQMRLIQSAFEKSARPAEPEATQNGGCYVATCVYGDYDAMQVLVLRRWRDAKLSKSTLGRAFIAAYYAIGPGIVRSVGDRGWFNVSVRHLLDHLVRALERRHF